MTAGLTGATSAFAAGDIAESGPVSASEQRDARAYWTEERMKNAKPMDKPIPAGKGGPPTSAPRGKGTPGFAGGTSAGQPTEGSGPGAPVGSESPTPTDGAFPGPHDTFLYFAKYRRYPISTHGKLFFTQNGGNYVCSGAVTYGGNANVKNTVWTAGHCVSDGTQTWNSSAVFCPSYDNGVNSAVGCWTATGFGTTSAWHNNGDFDRDFGVVRVGTGGNNNNQIADAVGGLGFSWNFPRDQHWMDFGYPSASPWTGGKLVLTAAEHRYDRQAGGGPASNSIGSGHTPGASGGAWILGLNRSGGYINSVNSHYYSGGPNGNEYGKQIQGPYHDTFACQVWDAFTGWPGTC